VRGYLVASGRRCHLRARGFVLLGTALAPGGYAPLPAWLTVRRVLEQKNVGLRHNAPVGFAAAAQRRRVPGGVPVRDHKG